MAGRPDRAGHDRKRLMNMGIAEGKRADHDQLEGEEKGRDENVHADCKQGDPCNGNHYAATVVMIAITGVALFAIRVNVFITALLLALELIVVSTLTFGYTHVHQSFSIVTSPVGPAGHGALSPITVGILVGAIATALFSVNGYDSAINFSEETTGSAK